MATNDNTPPFGGGNIPADAMTILSDCSTATATVAQGIERLGNHQGLPQAARDELDLLRGLAQQLIEAFENLREWLESRFGADLTGLAKE